MNIGPGPPKNPMESPGGAPNSLPSSCFSSHHCTVTSCKPIDVLVYSTRGLSLKCTLPTTHTSIWATPKEAIIAFVQLNAEDCNRGCAAMQCNAQMGKTGGEQQICICQGHSLLTLSFVMRHCISLLLVISKCFCLAKQQLFQHVLFPSATNLAETDLP